MNPIFRICIVISALIAMSSSEICAQKQMRAMKPTAVNSAARIQLQPSTTTRSAASKQVEEDAEYYREVTHKYSWMTGLGKPISKEQAMQLPVYYKFTYRHPVSGRWQHVQLMHGEEMVDSYPNQLYGLIDENQTSDWQQRVNAVAQWLITTTTDGKSVVEERAYDRNGDLVYCFQPLINAEGDAICCFTDAWGYPVDFREDPDYYYGTALRIKYDENGNDAVIDYLDGNGLWKHNVDGVDRVQYVYDSDGRVLQATSRNVVGDAVNNSKGIYLIQYSYNPDGSLASKLYYDKDMNLIISEP